MRFPPVENASPDGLLAIGGNLAVDTLRDAYHSGIFPWPVEDYPLLWFAPPRRSVLGFEDLHVSRRLRRTMRHTPFDVRFDCDFAAVIQACADQRVDDEGTWITDEMLDAYQRLHEAGDAHSVETYLDGRLVGGLYGVAYGAYFAGESMFHRVTDASKVALVHLAQHLRARGATWLDTQMITPLFAGFGASEISRARFMRLLRQAVAEPVRLFD